MMTRRSSSPCATGDATGVTPTPCYGYPRTFGKEARCAHCRVPLRDSSSPSGVRCLVHRYTGRRDDGQPSVPSIAVARGASHPRGSGRIAV
jgi:hypothetical protein